MTWLARGILVGLILLNGTLSLSAASKAEDKAFSDASMSFLNSNWERAEREFGSFLDHYPKSENRAEAVLLRAESRIKLKNFAGAIQLLTAGRSTASNRADEYLFWLAQAHFEAGEIEAAADLFGRLPVEFPASPRRLEAVVAEAAARSQLKQWGRVVDLLQMPDGLFQTLAKELPTVSYTVRGRFFLADAFFAQGRFSEAQGALAPLANEKLSPQFAWQRDYLLAKIQLAAGQPELALKTSTNLTVLVDNQPALAVEGLSLIGRIHEALGQTNEAIATWKLILTPAASAERQREALLRVGDLLLGQGRLAEAAQTLETFLAAATNSPAADVAWLTLGEFRLRSQVATNAIVITNGTTAAATNLFSQALSAFDTMLKEFPTSPLAGKAHLGRGWCLSLEDRVKESGEAFQAAVKTLAPSYDQAVARFKLADALMLQKDFAGALTNYQRVAANPSGLGEVRSNLVERALCQAVRAAAEAGEPAAATSAMAQLLEEFPEGTLVENALLLVGNQQSSGANPAARRAVLEGFLEKSPDSQLASGVRLAVARTYEQQRNWPKVESEYAAWLAAYPDDPARPRAEYNRALAAARSGNETNGLTLFTNFVAHFPTNGLTPYAQWWVADYYWRAEDFVNSERNYQLISDPKLRFEAQLMAGRAAVARQRPEEAVSYFTNLLRGDLNNCPSNITAQAMFAYGDTLMMLASADTNQALLNFRKAIQVFSKIVQLNPDTKIAPLAQGKMGDCYLQLGAADPVQYSYASNAYQQVLTASLAGFAEKAKSEIGLGLVLEREAQLASGTNGAALTLAALDHYWNVLQQANEATDLFWIKRAGLEALRLRESMRDWEQVAKLCDTLGTLLPPLQPALEKKKARAIELLARPAE